MDEFLSGSVSSATHNPKLSPPTLEEILREILQESDAPGEAMTAREIADRLGISQEKAREILRAAIGRGEVEVIRVRRAGIDGIARLVPAYRRRAAR